VTHARMHPESEQCARFVTAVKVALGAGYEHYPAMVGTMTIQVEFFNWWIIDERTGQRRLTTYKLSRADAERAFAGAEPDLPTGELRNLPGALDGPRNSRPGGSWSD
jgi:hypothetical protein